ncbi:hypothetical protein [Chitiniphilus eburneus]|uniref:Uncharacterized protein n=1 Tax=Chitiniphilus eburneus TaxID=2571148 RepID=A0A4U0PAG2_9NEIS|nr:hypothetical protein [Chitiniphilus eburneus]TJZ64621.1 hypothetical protein FAZ21_18895 [Chitiniphilus eburneus]
MDFAFGGGMNPEKVPRVKSLGEARMASQTGETFKVQPGGSSFGVYEGWNTHVAYTQGTSWSQQVATPSSTMSTKYKSLAPNLNMTDLTRANKALVAGHSDMLSPPSGGNNWRGKTFNDQGALTATLLRVNEASTAFGHQSMGVDTHDAGTGMMAQVLSEKWAAKSQKASSPDMATTFAGLTKKFPQLDTVEKMRGQKTDPLVQQIADSRFGAALAAGQRGLDKGHGAHLGEYVQHKFNKHGLGQVPGGWADALRARHGK